MIQSTNRLLDLSPSGLTLPAVVCSPHALLARRHHSQLRSKVAFVIVLVVSAAAAAAIVRVGIREAVVAVVAVIVVVIVVIVVVIVESPSLALTAAVSSAAVDSLRVDQEEAVLGGIGVLARRGIATPEFAPALVSAPFEGGVVGPQLLPQQLGFLGAE